MKYALRGLSLFLAALTVLVLGLGTLGIWYFGTPHLRTINLTPGTEVSFYALRLRAQQPQFTFLFRRDFGSHRPELGHWDSEHFVKEGLLYLQPNDPGAKVEVEVRIAGTAVPLEALPAQAGDMEHWERRLIPKAAHPDPLRIPWPPNWDTVPRISPPIARVVMKIVNVEGTLLNESVTLALRPPVTRVRVEPGYEIFVWFQHWKLNLVVALVCLMYVMNNILRRATI